MAKGGIFTPRNLIAAGTMGMSEAGGIKPVAEKAVGAIQSSVQMPDLAEPEEAPTAANSSAAMDAAAAQQRRARSRSATILAANAPQGQGSISRRVLLGA